MRSPVKPHRCSGSIWFVMATALALGGCATPPSVAPLLRVTERALLQESDRLRDDAERDAEYVRQTLGVLEDGYSRDLDQVESLTPDWVREATSVYVTAREIIIQHQNTLARERNHRAENLKTAALAERRAIVLIEQQDRLLTGAVGEDLRRLISGAGWNREESGQ